MSSLSAFFNRCFCGLICCWLGLSALALAAAPSRLNPDEEVEFYPVAASLQIDDAGNGFWRVPLRVHVFEMEDRDMGVELMAKLLGFDTSSMIEGERRYFQMRARLFLVDNQRRKWISARVAGKSVEIGPTQGDGTASQSVRIPTEDSNAWPSNKLHGIVPVEVVAHTNYTRGRVFVGKVFLVPPKGWTVISDIDDTIKVSQVRDSEALIRNTFCLPFKPVEGMAAIFQLWQKEFDCVFFYVSGSPWALYQPLNSFLEINNFPSGILHLRPFNIGNKTVFNLLKSPVDYKLREISAIMERFPDRCYVLVGDSGEQDPEIYGALARAHRDKIKRIYIRDVTGESRSASRYQSAFSGLPDNQWSVFAAPSDLRPFAKEK